MPGIFSLLYSPIISTASLLLALLSISLACFFYRRGQRTKVPCWGVRTTTLVEGYSSSLADLRIAYKEHLVEDLSVSRIVFWNDGRETIDGGDIAAANPLRVATEGDVRILDAKVVASNNPSSCFSVSLDQGAKWASVAFDYLDKDQGAILQIVHTGTCSDDLLVDGDIKGSTSLRRKDIRVFTRLPLPTPAEFDKRINPAVRRRIRALVYCAVGLLPLVVGFISVVVLLLMNKMEPELLSGETALDAATIRRVLVLGVAVWSLPYVAIFWRGITYWRSQIPSGLESFEEDIVPK